MSDDVVREGGCLCGQVRRAAERIARRHRARGVRRSEPFLTTAFGGKADIDRTFRNVRF